ncbi:hypothetical protein FN846DRAFT_914141 [Sphaerosporella brunnea]|uniref:Retrotransposon gag domain-containing protein n=1 Tax=Sphaerosporella brunnea TaxID=1250544 RepID=A0A5J5EDB1_9PEZI|nr:hypothetical protein FN846DRAFT_914141 [Sphaerosporella brunnea]
MSVEMSDVIKTASSDAVTATAGPSRRQPPKNDVLRTIFETFERADAAFEKLHRTQEKQEEDEEMIDILVEEKHQTLRARVQELHDLLSKTQEIDAAQKAFVLQECQQFGAQVKTETLRLGSTVEQLKQYTDAVAGKLRVVVARVERQLEALMTEFNQVTVRLDRLYDRDKSNPGPLASIRRAIRQQTEAHNAEVESLQARVLIAEDLAGQVDDLRQQVRELQDARHDAQRQSAGRRRPRPEHTKILDIPKPPTFSGNKKGFRRWWAQVTEYLEVQPARLIPNDRVKIAWLRGLMKDGAQDWIGQWRKSTDRGEQPHTWDALEIDIRRRYLNPFEGSRALRELQQLKYEGDTHAFLTKFDLLNADAELTGHVYQQTLLKTLPKNITTRISLYEKTDSDAVFREYVLKAGVDTEDWEERMRDEDRRAWKTVLPSRRAAREDVSRQRLRGDPRPKWKAEHRFESQLHRETELAEIELSRRKYSDKFASVAEATKGVPKELVEARTKAGDCLRCGWPKGMQGQHRALQCHREVNPKPWRLQREGKEKGTRIAALSTGKRGREEEKEEDSGDDTDPSPAKRGRLDVAGLVGVAPGELDMSTAYSYPQEDFGEPESDVESEL